MRELVGKPINITSLTLSIIRWVKTIDGYMLTVNGNYKATDREYVGPFTITIDHDKTI